MVLSLPSTSATIDCTDSVVLLWVTSHFLPANSQINREALSRCLGLTRKKCLQSARCIIFAVHAHNTSQSSAVTGMSALGVKFKDGVVIAADNLASCGSLAGFTDVKRLRTFSETSIIGFGGDVSDKEYLDRLLASLDIRET